MAPFTPQNLSLSLSLPLLLLLLLSLLAGASSNSQLLTDPCESVGLKFSLLHAVRPSEFRKCLATFPYNPKEAKILLDLVWQTIVGIYPYSNLAKKSPTPQISSNVRLRKHLLRIQKSKYVNDFGFQNDIVRTLDLLNDGHTEWRPNCYHGTAIAATSFPIIRFYDTQKNTTRMIIFPDLDLEVLEGYGPVFNHTEQSLNISLSDYKGAEVLEINGIPAMKYVENFAKQSPGYRDPQVRLNSLFMRPAFQTGLYYVGGFMRPRYIPKNDTITLKVRRVNNLAAETLEVPYFVYYKGKPFNSSMEYYALNCAAPKSSVNGERAFGEKMASGTIHYHAPREQPGIKHRVVPDYASVEAFGFTSLSASEDNIQVYLLPSNKTAVMAIPDFQGAGAKNASMPPLMALYGFLGDLLAAYKQIMTSGASRLIIDLSNNGGGYAATSGFLTQLFFPEDGDPQFPLQFKASWFPKLAYSKAATIQNGNSTYHFANYFSLKGEPFNKSSQFFYPLENVTQNNFTAEFSSLFLLQNFKNSLDTLFPGFLPNTTLLQPPQILLLSNGMCYSACSNFAYQMRQRHNVTLVTAGGHAGPDSAPFAFSDGSSGFVTDYDQFYIDNVVGSQLQQSSRSLKPLPVQGNLRFTVAQSYGPKSSKIPQEFIYEPGQFQLQYTDLNVLSLGRLWQEAERFFGVGDI